MKPVVYSAMIFSVFIPLIILLMPADIVRLLICYAVGMSILMGSVLLFKIEELNGFYSGILFIFKEEMNS
jgi:hypothetical protein